MSTGLGWFLDLPGGLGAARRDPVPVLLAERARIVLCQRVAVPLAVRSAHERRDDVEVPLADVGGLPPQVGKPKIDIELEEVDP